MSLLDGRRRWRITSNSSAAVDPGHALTCCETVVCTGEAPVVDGPERDARFAAAARVGEPLPSFSAGVPVHAEDGTAIGAMCVLESARRPTGTVDLDRLRDLAYEAAVLLRGAVAAVS